MNMGITPIVTLTPLPAVRHTQPDLAPLPTVRHTQPDLAPLPTKRVESLARTGDETYSPSNERSARGNEDEDDEIGFESAACEEPEPISHLAAKDRSRHINYVA
jgi:hypothetical protein